MRRSMLAIPAVAVVLAVVLPIAASARADDEAVWLDSFQKALETAKAESKPILLHLVKSGDDSSLRMTNESFVSAEVKPHLSKFILVRIDIEKQPDALKRITGLTIEPVYAVPDTRILDAKGKMFGHLIGFADQEQLIAFIEKGLEDVGKG